MPFTDVYWLKNKIMI